VKFRPRNRKQLAILMTLAWREQEAQERNMPRNGILKDDAIAKLPPRRRRYRRVEVAAALRGIRHFTGG
jgi:ribonuclease D